MGVLRVGEGSNEKVTFARAGAGSRMQYGHENLRKGRGGEVRRQNGKKPGHQGERRGSVDVNAPVWREEVGGSKKGGGNHVLRLYKNAVEELRLRGAEVNNFVFKEGEGGVTARKWESDAHGDAVVMRNHEAGHQIGCEKQCLCFDNAAHVHGSKAGIVSEDSGEVSFGNDIKDPDNWVEPDGPLKRGMGATHAEPFDKRDEGTSETSSANADVSVESDDVKPSEDPGGHGKEGPASAKPLMREKFVGLDLVNERNDSHKGAGGEEVVEPGTEDC